MKIARFRHEDRIQYGVVDDADVVVLKGDPMVSGFETIDHRIPLTEITLLAPVIPRSKVVCVGKNYRDHAAEMGGEVPAEPLLFLKPNTSVIGPNDPIIQPSFVDRVDYEGELAVVIGQVAKNVPAERAMDVVFGFTIGNDVTARELQQRDGQWTRAKGFDTFCPLGPVIETEFDLTSSSLTTEVNGQARQHGTFDQLVFSIPTIIEYASAVFTLLPGDVILTGTPAGIGPMNQGDTVTVNVAGIGSLSNTLVSSTRTES